MDFEKKLEQIVNQPSFQKKSDLKGFLLDSQNISNRFYFIRPSFFYRLRLKYKLLLRFNFFDFSYLIAKKSFAVGLASLLIFSFVSTPFLSTGKYIETSEYVLSRLSGDVVVLRGRNKIDITDSIQLLESDKILVASNSIAELQVMESSVLRLGQNTVLGLGGYSKTPFLNSANLELEKGTVWVNTKFDSMVPLKLDLNTNHMQFDVYKNSNFVVKSNANSLLAHNYSKPVSYSYKNNDFVISKSASVSINSNKRSDIFNSNFLSFIDVNRKLDIVLDDNLKTVNSRNKQIAGLVPGDFMYPLDLFEKWVSRLTTVDKLDHDINMLTEKIAETNLVASNNPHKVSILRDDLKKVTDDIKADKNNLESSKKLIESLNNAESSLDSSVAPEAYFEIKSMISKAKIDLIDDEVEKSNIAIQSANQILNELSSVDSKTKEVVLPKVLDELNFVLETIDKKSSVTASSRNVPNSLDSVLEESLIMTNVLDSDIVVEKDIVEKVSKLKENLDDIAHSNGLNIEINQTSTSIEYDLESDSLVEINQIFPDDVNNFVMDDNTDSLELSNVEQPEEVEVSIEEDIESVIESDSNDTEVIDVVFE